VKRQELSGEVQRTAEKIKHCITNPTPDSADRVLSAAATQSGLAISIGRLEAQPSEAGKLRKGYRSPMRHAVKRIKAASQRCDLERLLDIFERAAAGESEFMLNLQHSASDPIKVSIQEVDRQKERVYYRVSDGSEKKIMFKTLNNYLLLPD
jgi:hypothetical protein